MTGPLAGLRVVVTRAEHQAGTLARLLGERGADVRLLPLLEVVSLPAEELRRHAATLSRCRWLVFTSANTVAACSPLLEDPPPRLHVAAVGSATRQALEARGLSVHLEPKEARAEGLLAALLPRLEAGDRVFLPQAEDARPLLAEGLKAAGFSVEAVTVYAKKLPADAAAGFREIFGEGPLGWVTFTSPSTVRAFVELASPAWPSRCETLLAVSIGPITSQALREQGREPAAEAAEPSAEGLVAALEATAAG